MECIEDIYSVAYKNKNLMSVMIELTNRCNWKCEHCYVTDVKHNKYNIENLKQLFIRLRKYGVNEITLIGGEIFLRDDIFDIISLARSMFFQVVLETNISLLNESKVKKLKELCVSEVACSIFSLDEKIHDHITGVKGSLNKVLNNLGFLKKYNIQTIIKTPLMCKNKDDYKKLNQYCLEQGFIYKINTHIFTKRNGETLEYLNIPKDDMKYIIKDIDKINNFSISKRSLNDYICINLRSSLFFDTQGDAYPCVNFRLPLGNIFLDGLDSILSNNNRNKVMNLTFKDMKECSKCTYLNKCSPCPGLSYMDSGSFIDCTKINLNTTMCR